MKFEREAGIHLHASICRRQSAAGRDLIDVSDRKAWLQAFRQPVEITVGDSDELFPGEPLIRRRPVIDVALLVDCAFSRNAEVVRAYGREFGFELLGRMKSRTPEHYRHAAADRTIAWQRIE